MDKEKNKVLFNADSSWKYFLIALVIIIIAYFIGTAFFKIFPSMETHF